MRKSKFSLAALGVFLLALLIIFTEQTYAQDEDSQIQLPYIGGYTVTSDCNHGGAYISNCPIDLAAGNGTPLYSPITGKITSFTPADQYGNPVWIVENSRYKVLLLHADFTATIGNVSIGQQIGTESNKGYTLCSIDGKPPNGRNCGYHTHIEIVDKITGQSINPLQLRSAVISNQPEQAGKSRLPEFAPPGKVDWNTVGHGPPGPLEPQETLETNIQKEVIEYWEVTFIQKNNSFKTYLAGIHWGWFAVLAGALLWLMGNRRSQHWWPFWLVLLVVVGGAFIWSRSPVQAEESIHTPLIPIPEEMEIVTPVYLDEGELQPRQLEEVIFPDPPEPKTDDLTQQSKKQKGECQVSAKFPEKVRNWCDIITTYANQFELSPDLIAAVIWQESGGNPQAYSRSGAVGLMQVMPRDGIAAGFTCKNGPCFATRPSIKELQDPDFNVKYGVKMLAGLNRRHGNLRDALMAYGPANVGYYYADKVLGIFEKYGKP